MSQDTVGLYVHGELKCQDSDLLLAATLSETDNQTIYAEILGRFQAGVKFGQKELIRQRQSIHKNIKF